MAINYRYEIGETIKDDKRDITIKKRWFEPRKRGKHIVNIKYYNCECNRCGKLLTKKEESSLYNHGAGCLSCKNKHPYVYSVGERIFDSHRDFTVLSQIRKHEKSNSRYVSRKFYLLKCNICGLEQEKSESNLCAGQGCCQKHDIKPHGDYIYETRPDLIPYFVDKDIPYKYGTGSSIVVDLQCPICGFKKVRKINYLTSFGFACPQCGDGFSYPQKFLYSILRQSSIDFIPEYSPDWANGRKYDSYFVINDVKLIVETDGEFHFENNEMNGFSAEKSQIIDNEKDFLAIEHGIKIIRIECRKSNKDYIKDRILNSELSNIITLDQIDWDRCDIDASKSIFVDVCKYYDKNRNISVSELCKIFGVSDLTIWKYLKKGREYGICPTYQTRYDIKNEKYLQAIKLFNEYPQMEIKEIARRINRDRNTVSSYLKKGNIEGLCKYIPHPRKRI